MHPDPTGAQLSVLREALQRIIAGQLKAGSRYRDQGISGSAMFTSDMGQVAAPNHYICSCLGSEGPPTNNGMAKAMQFFVGKPGSKMV